MRISLVSEHASPLALVGSVDAGGQNIHVATLAIELARLGAEVTVHTRRDDPAQPAQIQFAPGVIIDHVDAGPAEPVTKDRLLPFMDTFANELVRRWCVAAPDIVHSHFWMSAIAAQTAAERCDVPHAVTFHASGVAKRRYQGINDTSPTARLELEEWLVRRVDHIIATTAHEADMLEWMGAAPQSITVIPCGVDLDLFRPDGARWSRTAPHRVVCLSRLVPRKGLLDVVEALAPLDDVELVIAGGPPAAMLSDDPYAAALMDRARALGAASRVVLTGGLDRTESAALLRSADVVCCTPWYEPFGRVALEAMACGVPVVATQVGGLAETVVDGQTGLFVPPRRPRAIRQAVATVIRQPSLRQTLSAASLHRADRYAWPDLARRALGVYEKMQQRRALVDTASRGAR
jgi:glycosyltransferase involved in cell wall biosynthesis